MDRKSSTSSTCVSRLDPVVADAATPDTLVARLRAVDDEETRRRLLLHALSWLPIDELLTLLKAESARYLMINGHDALRLAQGMIAAAALADRPGGRGLGLLAEGDALRYLGQYQRSLDRYEEARQIFLDHGDEIGWARTYLGWVLAAHYLGRGAEAVASVGPAHDVLVRHGVWIRVAGLDLNTAIAHHGLGQYDRALALYDRAQQVYASLGASAEVRVAWTKADKAMVLTLQGNFRQALVLLQEARDTIVRHGETANVLRLDQYTADVHAGQGHYTRALRLYGEVLATQEGAGLDLDAAQTALSMVACYLSLNRAREALELAEDAVARYERCGTPTETARARFACALALARLGSEGRALALLDAVGQQFAAVGLEGQFGIVALQRSGLHLRAARWSAALEEATFARERFVERGLSIRQAQAEFTQARALLGLARPAEAQRLADAATTVAAERGVLWLAHEGHHIHADIALAEGDVAGARAAYRAAIAGIEVHQTTIASELRSNFLEDKLQIYHDAIDCSLRQPNPDLERAFDYLERAKSRALVDYLAAQPEVRVRAGGAAQTGLLAELTRLRREHQGFYNRLYGYELAPPRHGDMPHDASGEGTQTPGEVAALEAIIRDRERAIARLQERLAIAKADGETDGLDSVLPQHIDRPLPRPILDDGTVLVELYLRHDNLAFVRTSAGLSVWPLATRPAEIRRLLRLWGLNLDASSRATMLGEPLDRLAENARGILQALYRALIAPIAECLAGRDRLIIIPYGATHQVPFHALHDGQCHLIERLEVTVCPSSALLHLCNSRARPATNRALIMAFSDAGRLPCVLDEADAVAALLPGECHTEAAATRAALLEAAGPYGVLHLAAHGEARLDNPTFAHLKLADGQLNAADVFNLQLDGALVTLSGCETGRGVVTGGDEVIGLGRGFLFAGAATLVQSLWRVEDGSTARLMGHFYRALRAGSPKGAALRLAQRALLDDDGRHPYHWAPFQLLGDSGLLTAARTAAP